MNEQRTNNYICNVDGRCRDLESIFYKVTDSFYFKSHTEQCITEMRCITGFNREEAISLIVKMVNSNRVPHEFNSVGYALNIR